MTRSRRLMIDGAELTDRCIEATGTEAWLWNAWCDRRPKVGRV